jgi:adenosylmethionine-8-amino-7-oxononanoate aminotransferase
MTLGEALWHGQAHMPTTARTRLTIAGGDGAYVTTDDGRRLLDATAGLWHTNVGHGRERIARAAYDQMCRLETYHCFGRFANEPALRLADRLSALGPVPGAKVMLTSGGSDSVDLACKLALRHAQLSGDTTRTVLVSRERAYHGLHGLGTSIAGLPYNRDGYGTPSLVPDTARIPTNDLDGARDQIEEIGPERVAAIVAEPVIGTGGVHGPSEGYLEGLQALAREIGALFVADEVITGFGRTGRMLASERWDLQPDIITLAKGLTSGYAPLGAVLVAPRVADRFFADGPDTPMFRHGLTYSGHATACAVAEANLDILAEEELVARAAALEDVLTKVLDPLRDHPLVTEVRSGAGFLAGVALRADVDGAAVAADATDSGVILRAIHENTLQICPPFVVTDDEVAHIATTIRTALDRRVP